MRVAISVAAVAAMASLLPAAPVNAAPKPGSIKVVLVGAPPSVPAQLLVTGPGGLRRTVDASSTLSRLTPGKYTIATTVLETDAATFRPDKQSLTVTVRAGRQAQAVIRYSSELRPPGAPGTPTGSGGDGDALVVWTQPTTGGAPDQYVVTSTPGGFTCTSEGASTQCTVVGLTNGTAYTFAVVASNSAGTSPSSQPSTPVTPQTCALGGRCKVGSTGPGGGIVFYVHSTRQAWGQYLEMAPEGWSGSTRDPQAKWGCSATSIAGTSGEIGSGAANTDRILSACAEDGIAARKARAYQGAGFSNWSLPSSGEAERMMLYLQRIGKLSGYVYYWTSTQSLEDAAFSGEFMDGYVYQMSRRKSLAYQVRPIRAF